MPLIHSASDKALHMNIAEMIRSGRRPDVAQAAAFRNQREMMAKQKAKKKK